MSLVLKIGVVCACLLFVWYSAKYQAKLFKEQKRINHAGKTVLFLLFCAALTVPFAGNHNYWQLVWKIPLLCISERLAFFDIILNKIRNKPFSWNGATFQQPSVYRGSYLDQLENQLPASIVIALRFCYIILFIIVLIVL